MKFVKAVIAFILFTIFVRVSVAANKCQYFFDGAEPVIEGYDITPDLSPLFSGKNMRFVPRVGEVPTSFKNALAMDIPYQPILALRQIISQKINRPLDFYRGWEFEGEAHITVVTPPEYVFHLRDYIKLSEINEIAEKNLIQSSEIRYLGIGSGRKIVDGKEEETFFVIVESNRLLEIRKQIEALYIKRGGNSDFFKADAFHPHITIGYTLKDFHLSDGIIKDEKNSLDPRFN